MLAYQAGAIAQNKARSAPRATGSRPATGRLPRVTTQRRTAPAPARISGWPGKSEDAPW